MLSLLQHLPSAVHHNTIRADCHYQCLLDWAGWLRCVSCYHQSVGLCRDRDGGPVQSEVLLVAVNITNQLHHGEGAERAHSQAMIRGPAQRLQPGHRAQQRHHRLPLHRAFASAHVDILLQPRLSLNYHIRGQRYRWVWRTGGRHFPPPREGSDVIGRRGRGRRELAGCKHL